MTKTFKLNQLQFTEFLKKGFISYDFVKKQKNNFFYYWGKWQGVTLTLYSNYTLLLQGKEKELQLFLKKEFFFSQLSLISKRKEFISVQKKIEINSLKNLSLPYFGCDESGLGDLFGPLVLTVFYLDADVYAQIKDLPIQDSKKISNTKILQIAPKLLIFAKNFSTKIISNQEFNQVFAKKLNLKELLSFYYVQLLENFVKKKKPSPIIIDGYTTFKNFYNHYQKFNFFLPEKIHFIPKAESEFLAVAVASIISRYFFLQEIAKISHFFQTSVLLGASVQTKIFLKKLIAKHGLKKVENFFKKNYKYTV